MTYARLLLEFLVAPICVLVCLLLRDRARRRKDDRAGMWRGPLPYLTLAALVAVAMLYTSPWDNHLIATRVWWYHPAQVSGVTIGWIPVEELLFFPLQTLLIGLWCLWLAPRLPCRASATDDDAGGRRDDATIWRGTGEGAVRVRLSSAVVGLCLWLIALIVLRMAGRSAAYLGWELVWALPPLMLQFGLGGDILWRFRRLLLGTLIPTALYLNAVDALAISDGIWTIDPHQSVGILLASQLPLEEAIFFTLASALVAFGLVLGVAPETRGRVRAYLAGAVVAVRGRK